MKGELTYYLLIVLIIFLSVKKMLDIIIDIEFPTYKPPPTTGIWNVLLQLRDGLSVISLMFILGILIYMGKNTNRFITTVLVGYLIYDILYFLFDWGYIFKFIPKNKTNEHFVHIFDVYLNASMNMLLGLFSLYALVYIFYGQKIKETICS
jgi:hypothetical protein